MGEQCPFLEYHADASSLGREIPPRLARALAPQPEVLLLDEPFSNLDAGLREQVRRDVMEILRTNGVTAIFVTHDQEEALFVGDFIAVMRNGRIEQIDSPEEIFHHPATRFVAEFIGTVDFLPGWRSGDRLMTEVGSVAWPADCPIDADLEVMVRPDCLECYPSGESGGVIASKEFRGAFYLYKVSLSSGHSVRCLLPHTQEYAVGTRVTVKLRCGHSLLPFMRGQAIYN
jgi:iron(III) transport system ATP-binding protein